MAKERKVDLPAPLPGTATELAERGWDELDVLLVTGDAYVDHPAFGAALIGRVLEAEGLRVGVVAQPDWRTPEPLLAMSRPRLFCGVTAGNLDSMVANYTAARHRRSEDEYSEGGAAGRRPNHAAVVYAQLARRAFPGLPVVLGGIEASLRRLTHYDYWADGLKPSILLDAKADILVYGMGERAVREIARRLRAAAAAGAPADLAGIRGTARLLGARAAGALPRRTPAPAGDTIVLPSWEQLQADRALLLETTRRTETEQSPFCGRRLVQFFGDRAVVVDPPAPPLSTAELDALAELPFTRRPHPRYGGPIPAFTMIRDSVTVVRGCAGGCTFCGLGLHQGRFLSARSADSVLREVERIATAPGFHGTITDLGGPTANLYGCANGLDAACRSCRRASCLFPALCDRFAIREEPGIELLRAAARVPGVRHVFVQSGIRMDVALRTPRYLRELVRHHVSGHLKVAPEHLHPEVLRRMRKPAGVFERFREEFRRESAAAGREQYLVPYFIAGFPGCTEAQMGVVEECLRATRWQLQQVQDFIPLPMTPAAAMYATGRDYETGRPIFVARGAGERLRQRRALQPAAGPPRGRRR
ncbi:MAG TPA: YgiQ family radical SAM protein [bacterium]